MESYDVYRLIFLFIVHLFSEGEDAALKVVSIWIFLPANFFLASQSVNSFHCRIPNQIKLQSLVCFFLSTTDDHRYWLGVKASN